MGASDCELLGDGWLAQPVNAWSSLAYLVAAVVLLTRGRDLRSGVGAAALALCGVGSVAYHGPQPIWGDEVHDLGVVVLVAVTATVAVWDRRVPAVAVAALALGAGAYLAGRTDGPLCAPSSVVQWHAAWHVLTAVAAAVVLAPPAPRS